MAGDIRRTRPHKRTEVLSPVARPEQWKKLPTTCKSHIEQRDVLYPPPPSPTAQALTLIPTVPCCLCGNYGHAGKVCPESMHSSNSLRICTTCQELSHYSILCTKPPKVQPRNNLNAIPCAFYVVHHYGIARDTAEECTSVKYSNRTMKVIRTCHHILRMPEGRNQPDLNITLWLHDTNTLNDYNREMGNESPCEHLYVRLLAGYLLQAAKLIAGSLYIYRALTWQLIIPRGLQIKGMSAQNFFIQQAHHNSSNGGLDKTYQNLADNYHWNDSYLDLKKFVQSCEIWQGTKSSTQKPVELLTPLTVPQRPWIKIATDFSFLTQSVVYCPKLIPVMKFSD